MKKYIVSVIILFGLYRADVAHAQADASFIIEQITVEGNTKTRPNVIHELLPYAIGDTVSEAVIHAGVASLQQSNLFKNVTLKPRAGRAPGYLHLTFQVEERYWPALQFKGGFSELSGWYITPISINFDNLLGFGNRMSLDLTYGYRLISMTANYLNPNILDSDLDFLFRVKMSSQEFLYYVSDEQYSHRVTQGGYYTGFRSRSGFFRHMQFGWDVYAANPDSFVIKTESNEKFSELPEFISQYIETSHVTSAFTIDLNYDKRDLAAYPRHGWWIGLWYTHAVEQMGGTDPFDRLVADLRGYQALGSQIVLAGRLKAGVVSAKAPFYEKFYLGGPNSLRGYHDRSLSPISGGDQMLHGSLELRFPITKRHFPHHFLTGALFVDGGANILTDESLNEDAWHGSYGFGFRFRLPFIRMLRMDFAYPMNGGDSMIQFSIGHTF